MKFKNKRTILRVLGVLISLPILFLAFLILVVGPVDTSKENSVQYAGVVENIYEGGTMDIVFALKDHPNTFYINRGLEHGFTLEELRADLLGKEVDLWYAKSWTTGIGGHMTRLEHNSKVLFNEW
jgi:hypothetical protein